MREHSGDYNLGDRVRTRSGITGTVVEPPSYYDRSEGYPYTGWAVVVEEDADPDITLTRIERGLSPGSRHLVAIGGLTRIAE
jgi:hypothetical protein